jgi:hypothetical protein
MSPPKKLVIPLSDYERIFRVIFSVIDNHARTAHACLFFSIVGSLILKRAYRIDAVPVAGAAAFMIDSEKNNVVGFGRPENGMFNSYDDAFHCWIEADGIVVDFLAPLFAESARGYGHDVAIPSKMFQKPRSTMVASLDEFRRDGDFFLAPNPALSRQLFERFFQRVTATDLGNVCLTWYAKPPKKLRPMKMINDLGEIEALTLRGPTVTGAW